PRMSLHPPELDVYGPWTSAHPGRSHLYTPTYWPKDAVVSPDGSFSVLLPSTRIARTECSEFRKSVDGTPDTIIGSLWTKSASSSDSILLNTVTRATTSFLKTNGLRLNARSSVHSFTPYRELNLSFSASPACISR